MSTFSLFTDHTHALPPRISHYEQCEHMGADSFGVLSESEDGESEDGDTCSGGGGSLAGVRMDETG